MEQHKVTISITKKQLFIRVFSLILFTNLIVYTTVPSNTEYIYKEKEISPPSDAVIVRAKVILSTPFTKGKTVTLLDKRHSLLVQKAYLVEQEAVDSFESNYHYIHLAIPKVSLNKFLKMKSIEALPFTKDLISYKPSRKKVKYEITY